MRPVDRWHSGESDLAALAGAHGFGLARNRAFTHGNKRIAFVSLLLFVRLNGIRSAPDQAEATSIIISLAAGEVDEAGLTRWIRDNLPEPSSGLDSD